MKTAAQLVEAIRRNLGDRDWIGGGSFEEAALDAVNQAIVRVASTPHRFRALSRRYRATLQAGTSRYTLPDRSKTVTFAYLTRDSTRYTLIERSLSNLEARYQSMTSNQGRPVYYAVGGGIILLWPVPDADYDIYLDVVVWPDAISGSQNQPLGDPWDAAIEAAATAHMFAALQEPADEMAWEGRYQRCLFEAMTAENYRPAIKYVVDDERQIVPSNYWARG